jgi:hypothetical protein
MEEQIPEAWVGHEVTVFFGQGQQRVGHTRSRDRQGPRRALEGARR